MQTVTIGDNQYVYKIYSTIIALAILVHISYLGIFYTLGNEFLWKYNFCSTLFYLVMTQVARRGYFRIGVSLVHLEVVGFVITSVLWAGWDTGVALYAIALSSLVYFCPFNHKWVPYLFSLGELVVFLSLRYYSIHHPPFGTAVTGEFATWLYLYSALACFGIIIIASFISDLTASVTRKALQDENKSLEVIASQDELTGLLTRRSFFKNLDGHFNRLLIFAMGDIDDFKRINDTYGHPCGDYILQTIARLMEEHCGETAEIYRWGGEEFLFLFPTTPFEEAEEQLNTLCHALAEYPFNYGGILLTVTATFGMSSGYCNREAEADSLIDRADRMLYFGKRQGKNRVITTLEESPTHPAAVED